MKLPLVLLLIAIVIASADDYHPVREIKSDRANIAEKDPKYWAKEAQDAIDQRRARKEPKGKARNVVMFLGDGLSVPTLAAARTLLGQRKGATGEEAELAFESFPAVGLAKTYCVDSQIPDSACTATAYLCGAKANTGTIGVSAAVSRGDCEASADEATHIESIAEWALADGRDVGIVTTARVTHASPAGAFAKVADRNWETDLRVKVSGQDVNRCPDIAQQLIHSHPGNKFKVILGGGRQSFLPVTTIDEERSFGRRLDRRNLIQEWQADKVSRNLTHRYIWHRDQLRNIVEESPEYLLGLFESSHMQYHSDADPASEPTLAELTEAAIKLLSRNEKGFFLFVESGRIDHAHHSNNVERALDETIALSDAVQLAKDLLPEEDSLLIVTADHSHVMSFSGYSDRGSDILGPSGDRDLFGVPYMTLSYANGPGFRRQTLGRRPDVTKDRNYRTPGWRSHADSPRIVETHGGDDVAVFARGPHYSMFGGLYEQSQLPHLMGYAACLGPGRHACNES